VLFAARATEIFDLMRGGHMSKFPYLGNVFSIVREKTWESGLEISLFYIFFLTKLTFQDLVQQRLTHKT
jgi:hypothetical protein